MRRWIFAILVLVNLGLFLWGAQYIEPERPALTEAPADVNPDRMKLVSELPPNKLAARPKPAPPPPPAPTTDGQVCYRLGPIAEAAQLKKLEDALSAQTLAFTKRDETTRSVTGYRVFLPSFPSREQAERRRRELTKLGFRDHALMQDDGFQNAISLGLFSVEENAQNRLKSLAEKGVKAELRAEEETRTAHWLEVAPPKEAADVQAKLKTMLGEIQGANLTETPCPAPVTPVAPVAEPPAATN